MSLTLKELRTIEKAYSLSHLEFEEIIPGWGNTLRCKLSSREGTFFLKEKIDYLTSEDFKLKSHIYHILYDCNKAPLVPLKSNSSRQPYIMVFDKYYELFTWIEGKKLENNPTNLYNLGKSFCELQLKALSCSNNNDSTFHWLFSTQRQHHFFDSPESIINYLDFFNSCSISNILDKNLITEIIDTCTGYISRISWLSLQRGWIHGDASPDNAIIKRNKIFLLDLDDFRFSYRLWDMCQLVALIGGFRSNALDYKELNSTWDLPKISYLVEGFLSGYLLNEKEKDSLSFLVGIHLVTSFIGEFDLDDSWDGSFVLFTQDINEELLKLRNLLVNVSSMNIIKK